MWTRVVRLAATAMLCVPVWGMAQTKWDLASANPPTNFQTINLDRFIAEVDRATSGAVKITHHPNASLFKMNEIRRATQQGQVAIGEVFMGTLVNDFPLFAFDNVPFLLNSRAEANRFWEIVRPALEARLASQGMTLLYAQPWPAQGLYSTKPVERVDDLKGTRWRAQAPVFSRYAQAVGAQPSSIPYTELSQAIVTGAINSMMSGVTAAADLKFWDSMRYFYDLQAAFPYNIVFANTKLFNALPDATRAQIRKVAQDNQAASIKAILQLEQQQLKFIIDNGMVVRPASADLLKGLRGAAEPVIAEWVKSAGAEAQNALDQFRKR